MMTITHNMMAMNAQRQFGLVSQANKKSIEKLSSGYRINRAADGAAELAISEKMRRQIRGLNQGAENIQDGISAAQIMDGSLNEVQDILNRMTELSVKAANGTLDDADRRAIDQELRQLRSELTRTTQNTTFNEKPLLSCINTTTAIAPSTSGGKADVVFLIDNTGSMTDKIQHVNDNLFSFANSLSNCNVQYSVISYGDISEGASQIFPFTSDVNTVKSNIVSMNRTGGGDGPESALEGIRDAISYLGTNGRSDATKQIILITDANYHYSGDGSQSILTKDDVAALVQDSGVTLSSVIPLWAQSNYDTLTNGKMLNIHDNFYDSLLSLAGDISAAAGETIRKDPEDIRIQCSGEPSDVIILRTHNVNAESLGLSTVSCETLEKAGEAIDLVKKAAEKLATIRSEIGADQNRLEHAIKTNRNTSENTQASESVIRDTDMASEMMKLSLQNILSQAGTAMMTQANQTPQGVLALLE